MKSKIEMLYNPFCKIAGWKAFFMGAIIVSISVIIAYFGNQYYQGAMNVKLVADAHLDYAFLSQIVGLFIMVFLFYLAGIFFSKGVRFQDVLGTTILARYPYIIPAFFGYFFDFDSMNRITTTLLSGQTEGVLGDLMLLTVIGVIMLVILVLYIALLWNAFRVSTDIRGGKGIAIFIVALLMTDLLYYAIMYLINEFILI